MTRRTSYLIFVLAINIQLVCAQGNDSVRVWEESLVLPTYKMNADDVNPMFEKPLSYQGAQRIIYPYPLQDNFTNIREDKTYKALYLENEYIKLCVLPEIGGRLFYATDKTNNYEIFYRQHVIKPAHIGMLGAWISGGIEWCVFHHHRASTFMPVDYRLGENNDGSKTIWFGEFEPRHRMRWTIGITLHPGKSYIQADIKMFNRTGNVNSILYWANVATHVNDDYQVFFPPGTKYGVYHAKNDFIHWPMGRGEYRKIDYTGVDVSWWKNHPRPISIFAHEIQEGFLAGYDHGKQAGTIHVGNHHIVTGAKLWEWGPGEQGSMWDTKVLTDSDGPYAELMVGAYSDNQPDYSWIRPYEVKQATQYWYPLRQTGGVKSANLAAAMNLEIKDGEVMFGFNTTARHKDAQVLLRAKGRSVFEQTVDIDPSRPFTGTVPLPEGVKKTDLEGLLQTRLGRCLVSYKPIELEVPDKLPEVVEPPAESKDIHTIEQLYLTGLRVKQFHNARINPNDYFEEALRRDPGDSRCNIQLGLDAAQRGLYEQAAQRFRTARERISKDYTRPRDCEAYYQLGLVQKKQGQLNEAYNNLYRAVWDYSFRSAAYYNLAEIACLRGDFTEALDLVNNALAMNAISTKPLGIKSAILRRLGRAEQALSVADSALIIDPIDHLARNERILNLTALKRQKQIREESEALDKIMHDYAESYLELAVDYMNCGLWEEAVGVLTRAVNKKAVPVSRYPTIHYYLAYLYDKLDNQAQAHHFLQTARQCPTDYCFPFRLESLDVYNYAIRTAPNDGRTYYYLGNLLYDRQPEQAIKAWEKAVEFEPSLAIAHRNLGWGYYHTQDDISKAIAGYTQAVRDNPRDPRYYYELDILHERNGTNVQQRLGLLEGNHQFVEKHKAALVREIIVLVQAGNYDKSISYLTDYFFPIQEGNRRLHETHVDAHLLRGLMRYYDRKYKMALEDFLAADEYPQNHQLGRIRKYDREAQIYYFTGLCYQALDQDDSARKYFKKTEERSLGDTEYRYYQGLALRELGQTKKASALFDQLIALGREKLSKADEVDFFAKFGEGDLPHTRKAEAHYVMALGYLGQGKHSQARQELAQAVDLDVNHIWARHQLTLLTKPE